MDTDTILLECEEAMEKAVEYFTKELRGLRTGRATTALLEYIKVDYYGSATDLRELAAISVPEATQLLVKPFDPGTKSDIIKGIEKSGLGLNPMAEGNQIRINIPSPSADRRKQLSGQVKKMAEESRVTIRNTRRDANKHIDQLHNDPKVKLSDDARDGAKESVDDLTKKYTHSIDALADKKVGEIEEV
ncbi:MAG: ribosome recycling factor [Planctomycetota bacterium]|nr:ribosome recycling factor [Planctomycetota bacterium]MDA1105287.1 ribosome recycling factor [Planctomycetota bacterium]